MSSPNLQLTLNRQPYSLTPLPAQVVTPCLGEQSCRSKATHRVVSRSDAVRLLCNEHTVTWAREQGWVVTWQVE